jgi:hypothetical protein
MNMRNAFRKLVAGVALAGLALLATSADAATLYITEYANAVSQIGTSQPQVLPAPPLRTQTVAISGASAQSIVFGTGTKAATLTCDIGCSIVIGSAPTATTVSTLQQQGQTVTYGVVAGQQVAVIANSAGDLPGGGTGATSNVNVAQTGGTALVADDAPSGSTTPIPVGGIVGGASYTSGDRATFRFNTDGSLSIAPTVSGTAATSVNGTITDGRSNTIGAFASLNYNLVKNGSSTWDGLRGDTNGLWAQGNVAAATADAGNPVKVGGVYYTTLPTLTNGLRGDLPVSQSGIPFAGVAGVLDTGSDGRANTSLISPISVGGGGSVSTARTGLSVAGLTFNGSTWDRQLTCPSSAVINVAAGTTELVALTASQVIRVCSFTITGVTALTTAAFVYGTGTNCGTGTTSLTGAMQLGVSTSISNTGMNGSLFRTASANALCLTAVTGNVTGYVSYAKF